MSSATEGFDERLKAAIRVFWGIRRVQAERRGGDGEPRDRGERGAVTGGRQMDGFSRLIYDVLVSVGLSSAMIYCKARSDEEEAQPRRRKQIPSEGPQRTRTELPGWFRAEKDWDLLVVVNGALVAVLEFKSQVGSFGNNFNNRTEEALGSAFDLAAAYREGAFRPSLRPWLGYLMLLEDAERSTRPVRPREPHFRVFDEFRDASYARRYDILLTKLVRERLYDSACFLMSPREGGLRGDYSEPNPELSFRNFITSLTAHAAAVANIPPHPATTVQPETLSETAPAPDDPSGSQG